MKIVGIDPGQKGAIGVLKDRAVTAHMMPILAEEVDIRRLVELIKDPFDDVDIGEPEDGDFYDLAPDLVVIEQAQPAPNVTTCKNCGFRPRMKFAGTPIVNFKMGGRFYELRAMCTLMKWPFIAVRSMSWKSKVLVGKNWKGRSKEVAIEVIQGLYPDFDFPIHGGKIVKYKAEAMSEALCLALYGKQFHSQKQEDLDF